MMKLKIQMFASSNKTANYDLSQYVGTDKPTYLGDYNSDMQKIDAQMKVNETNSEVAKTDADLALANAETAQETANSANETANTANSTAENALSLATENQAGIVEINTKLDNIRNYSTSEVNTGIKWINDKDIYRKVINFGALPNNSEKRVNHNITNIDFITNMYGISYRESDKQYINIPYANTGVTYNGRLIFKETVVSVTTSNDMSGYADTYIVVEYTKK